MKKKLEKIDKKKKIQNSHNAKMIKPIVLSGPSGGGKSTILAMAMKDYPDLFAFSVSRLLFIFKFNLFSTF